MKMAAITTTTVTMTSASSVRPTASPTLWRPDRGDWVGWVGSVVVDSGVVGPPVGSVVGEVVGEGDVVIDGVGIGCIEDGEGVWDVEELFSGAVELDIVGIIESVGDIPGRGSEFVGLGVGIGIAGEDVPLDCACAPWKSPQIATSRTAVNIVAALLWMVASWMDDIGVIVIHCKTKRDQHSQW